MKTAVVKIDGRQFVVSEKASLRVRRRDYEVGAEVSFPDVLLVADGDNVKLGNPVLEGATVAGTVTAVGKTDKIEIFKYKAKKRERRRGGYREEYAQVSIKTIAA